MAVNDRVLVIGGTRGAGLLIARLLLRHGYRGRVLARDPARAASRLGSAVEVIAGDITKPETLSPAVQGISHLIFTAGVHSGRIAPESLVRLTAPVCGRARRLKCGTKATATKTGACSWGG